MVKLANQYDETQAAVRRYCDIPATLSKFACIVAFEPQIKRYRLSTPWTKANLLNWLEQWLDQALNEYVRVESISEPKVGYAQVSSFDQNLNTVTLNALMHDGTSKQKVVFMYSSKEERSMLARDAFIQLADLYSESDFIFGMIDLAKNELKEMAEVDLPAMVMLKGYADLNAVNYQGVWTLSPMADFVQIRM